MSAGRRRGMWASVSAVGFAGLLGITPFSSPSAGQPGKQLSSGRPGVPLPAGAVAHVGTLRQNSEGAILSLGFARDGKTLATGGRDGTFRLWDAATGRQLHLVRTGGTVVAIAPDGQTFASRADPWTNGGHTPGATVFLYNRAGEKQRQLKHAAPVLAVVFAPDGQTLATGDQAGALRLWDAGTGKELRRLDANKEGVFAIAFAPDGKLLASGGKDRMVCLWDTTTGKRLHRIVARTPKDRERDNIIPLPQTGSVTALVFSADGKVLASADGEVMEQWIYQRSMALHLWDAATGKELRRLQGDPQARVQAWVSALALSPDGRTLAGTDGNGKVRLWETATGGERRQFSGHRGPAGPVAFAPDGKTVASGGDDGTALVWEVLPRGPKGGDLTADGLAALWSDLADARAARGYEAVRRLLASPRQAAALLKEKLTPVLAVDGERIARLLRDLDSPRFPVRNRAVEELLRWGDLVLPFLREALASKPSLEVRQRLEHTVQRVEGERLRGLRAVEVLEHAGTAEARALLATLAGGAPQAFLTREARVSLRRAELSSQKPR